MRIKGRNGGGTSNSGRGLGDVSLRDMDAAKPKKRWRKDRKKPDPPENLVAAKDGARAFADSLPLQPGLIVEPRGNGWQVQAPHNDEELWVLQLVEAFGTRSRALLSVFVEQLSKLCSEDWDPDRQSWRVNESEWNAVLALVADWKPENSAQAALAAQMAATHLMTMRLSAQALGRGYTVNSHDAALTAKLARTFAAQCETMQTLQGKTKTAKQSIHVTKETSQHVHYHDHRGGGENGNQSHGRGEEARAPDECEAVWSNDESGDVLQGSSGERLRPLPVPRSKGGSAKG